MLLVTVNTTLLFVIKGKGKGKGKGKVTPLHVRLWPKRWVEV